LTTLFDNCLKIFQNNELLTPCTSSFRARSCPWGLRETN